MVTVFSSDRPMSRQPRPRGRYVSVDDVWKADIRALLEKKGVSQAELARRIGASPGSIVLLFKPQTVQSRLVPAIHKVLGLDPPAEATSIAERDDAKRRLDRIWSDFTPEDRAALLAVAERFQRHRH